MYIVANRESQKRPDSVFVVFSFMSSWPAGGCFGQEPAMAPETAADEKKVPHSTHRLSNSTHWLTLSLFQLTLIIKLIPHQLTDCRCLYPFIHCSVPAMFDSYFPCACLCSLPPLSFSLSSLFLFLSLSLSVSLPPPPSLSPFFSVCLFHLSVNYTCIYIINMCNVYVHVLYVYINAFATYIHVYVPPLVFLLVTNFPKLNTHHILTFLCHFWIHNVMYMYKVFI